MKYIVYFIVFCLFAGIANADIDDWKDFPEFRQNSGLPGNAYAVDPMGQVGFGGALHMNIPCAYTPSWGNIAVGGSYTHKSDDPDDRTDGALFYTVGFGPKGNGFSISEYFAETDLSVNAFNLQYQALNEEEHEFAVAIGVLDVLNNRLGENRSPHGGRSLYLVGTKQLRQDKNPLYLSVGFGSDRFNERFFGGLSWYPSSWLNIGAEYDGFMFRPTLGAKVLDKGNWELTAMGAYTDFQRPCFTLTLTHRK